MPRNNQPKSPKTKENFAPGKGPIQVLPVFSGPPVMRNETTTINFLQDRIYAVGSRDLESLSGKSFTGEIISTSGRKYVKIPRENWGDILNATEIKQLSESSPYILVDIHGRKKPEPVAVPQQVIAGEGEE